MNLTPWIACRYFLSRRSGRFAPFLAAVAVTGVAVGMMALVVIMSVMLGFRGEIADRLLGFDAHITLVRGPGAPALSEEEIRETMPKDTHRDMVPFVKGENTRDKVWAEGEVDAGIISAGQVMGLIHDVPPVQELVERIVAQAEEIIGDRLSAMRR